LSRILVLVLLVASRGVAGYSSGAPILVCNSMKPGHVFGAQTTPCPFFTKPEKTVIDTNSNLKVTLKSSDPEQFFKGFLIMAVDPTTQKAVGSLKFPNLSSAPGQTKSCHGNVENMATHHDSNPKSSVVVIWSPPQDWQGSIVFKTTFVQEFTKYWVKESSETVRVVHSPSLEESPVTDSPLDGLSNTTMLNTNLNATTPVEENNLDAGKRATTSKPEPDRKDSCVGSNVFKSFFCNWFGRVSRKLSFNW